MEMSASDELHKRITAEIGLFGSVQLLIESGRAELLDHAPVSSAFIHGVSINIYGCLVSSNSQDALFKSVAFEWGVQLGFRAGEISHDIVDRNMIESEIESSVIGTIPPSQSKNYYEWAMLIGQMGLNELPVLESLSNNVSSKLPTGLAIHQEEFRMGTGFGYALVHQALVAMARGNVDDNLAALARIDLGIESFDPTELE